MASSRQRHIICHKVEAHCGCAFNEAADSLAKAVARSEGQSALPPVHRHLLEAVSDGSLQWAWLLSHSHARAVQFPYVTDTGTWTAAAATCPPATRPVDMGIVAGREVSTVVHVDLHAVQYNCLSMKGEVAVQLLQAGLAARGVHVAGFQETRVPWSGISTRGRYTVLSAPCTPQGVGGCQIEGKVRAGRDGVGWDRKSLAVLVQEPQLLAVLVHAGPLRFALFSGHAPTAEASEAVRMAWWDGLGSALRRVPTRYSPVLMLDANARFHADPQVVSAMDACPDGDNAEILLQLCKAHGLCPTGQCDSHGQPVVSWASPQCVASLIDYFVCPEQWEPAMVLEQCPSLDDLHAAIDLRPRFHAYHARQAKDIDVTALHTAEGQRAVEHAFRTMPLVPWEVDSTTHVAILHSHLRGALLSHLPAVPRRPRNPAYTEVTIHFVRQKRRARKCLRAMFEEDSSTVMRAVVSAMQQCSTGRPFELQEPVVAGLASLRRHRVRVWAALHCQSDTLRKRMQQDKAAFLRAEMQQSRDLGSAHFAHRIRAILRSGRKFKAQTMLPALRLQAGGEAVGKEDVLHAMGSHYAAAERAQEVTVDQCLERRAARPVVPPTEAIQADHVPSLPAIARAIATSACRKAAGVSGVPPDVYRLAPHLAAVALFPIHCKLLLQGVCPIQWSGGCAHSIPKGSGDSSDLAAWRSIMLLEPEAKAIQKAWRPRLLQAAAERSPHGQHGGFSGNTLSMVSFRVRAHFLALKQQGMSGGVLFLDCKAAYYSVVRDLLALPASCEWDRAALQKRAELFFQTPQAQKRFVADVEGGGILHQMRADAALRRYVAAQTTDAWFTTNSRQGAVWMTESGTAPP